MKMDIINLIIFMNLIIFIECFYRRSRNEVTWSDARDQCEEFGGRLATPNNIARFHANIKDAGILLDDGDELWVGATLTSRAWRWQGLTDRPFIDNEHLYENKGCYHQQYWYGGTQQDSPSPRACLQLCQWQGRVGLKEDFCLCEQDILNISTTPDGYCHFKCTGSSSDMCGGVRGLSIYKPVNRSIYWATDEPKPDNDCVVLKRDGVHSKLELVSAKCHMQTRYLCRFEYDDKCGVNDVCIRASSSQTTWYKARTNCLAMNGSLAELDEADDMLMRDLRKLPPGSFWIALSRRRTWNWIVSNAVFMLNFFGHEKELSPERACAVVKNINGRLGLAGRPCTSRKQYFCQYDYMLKREDVSIPGANKTNQNSADDITFTFTTSRPVDTDVDGHRTDDKPTADHNTEGSQSEPAMLFGSNGLLNTCIYVVLGFVAGMVCVLVLGMIVYAVCRCTRPKQTKHAPLGTRQDIRRRNHDNQSANSVSYSSKDESLQIQTASPPSDITYDSVYDQGESPFRRTQRIIRMGSANSWRHSLPRKPHSDLYEPMNADFTWRGIVGGKEEVLNTQLRETSSHTDKDVTDGHFRTSLHSADVHDHVTSSELNQHSLMRRQQKINDDIRKDFDEIEGLYDLPGPVIESCSSKRATVNLGFQPETPRDERKNHPTFLNLEAKIDETSNDENIYATIKKTFQKLNDELASAESDSNSEMMYTVKLN